MTLDRSKKINLLIFLLITFATGITALILGKDANWDLKNYHYYNGYAFLTGRLDYDIAPAQIQTYLNPLFDVFVYLGIKYLPAKVFGFVLGAMQGVGIWLVYLLSRFVTRGYPVKSSMLIAILAAFAAFSGAGWFSEIGNTMGDNIVSIFVLSALLLTVSCPSPITLSNGKRILIGAGFLLGFCTGLKLVAAVYFVGFFISLIFLMDKRQIVVQYVVLSASFAVGMAASIGFWMVKLWEKFQSPLFPFYNKIFHSPYFEHSNFADGRFLPKTLWQKIFYPFFFAKDPQLVSEIVFRDFRLPVLYVVISLFLLWSLTIVLLFRKELLKDLINDNRKTYFLVSFAIISYFGWQMMFSVYRYVITLELLTPVVVIAVLTSIMKNQKLSGWLSTCILFFLIVTVIPMNWGRRPWGNSYISLTASAPLAKFENSTILMSGSKPTSYVIPFFPKSTKFVRIESAITRKPGRSNKLQLEIDKAIHESQNLKMFVTDPSDVAPANARNVDVDLNTCDLIVTSMGDKFALCDASVTK